MINQKDKITPPSPVTKFHSFSGEGVEIQIKVNTVQLELELGLSYVTTYRLQVVL